MFLSRNKAKNKAKAIKNAILKKKLFFSSKFKTILEACNEKMMICTPNSFD